MSTFRDGENAPISQSYLQACHYTQLQLQETLSSHTISRQHYFLYIPLTCCNTPVKISAWFLYIMRFYQQSFLVFSKA